MDDEIQLLRQQLKARFPCVLDVWVRLGGCWSNLLPPEEFHKDPEK